MPFEGSMPFLWYWTFFLLNKDALRCSIAIEVNPYEVVQEGRGWRQPLHTWGIFDATP